MSEQKSKQNPRKDDLSTLQMKLKGIATLPRGNKKIQENVEPKKE